MRQIKSYMRYEVVAVDINRGEDQTGHEHNQAKCQAAQAVEQRLPGTQRQDQLFFILENTHTNTHTHTKASKRAQKRISRQLHH